MMARVGGRLVCFVAALIACCHSFQLHPRALVVQRPPPPSFVSFDSSFGKHHRQPLRRSGIFAASVDEADLDLPVERNNLTAALVEQENSALTEDATALAPPPPQYPPTPTLRECLAFTLPALGIYTCPPLMSLIDASFIGRLSSSLELASLGPASTISDSAPLPLLFLSIAATNLIAKSFAQNDTEALARVTRTALTMGTVGGIVTTILLYQNALPLSLLYCGGSNSAGGLAAYCTQYVAIRALALPFVVVTTIAQAICIGTKDTKTPMLSVALAGGLNLLGDLILVGWLKQGIAGAAWATAVSQVLAAGLLLRVLKKRGFLEKQQPQSTQQQPGSNTKNAKQWDTAQQILSFVPFLFVMSVKIGWHNSCAATAATLGGAQAAAHTALVSVGMLCFTFGDVGSSLSQAFLPAFVRQPQQQSTAEEEGRKKNKNEPLFDLDAAMPTIKQLLRCTLSISTTVVLLSSIIIGIFGGQITGDPLVLAEMRRTLPWIATALSLHGTAVSLEGFLLARKKLRGLTVFYTFLAATIVAWQFFTRRWGLGLGAVWGCYIWVSGSRVVTFAALGGLLRPQRMWKSLRQKLTSRAAAGTVS
ncbi:Protein DETOXIFICATION [Seminavis robusta]|uniref:Protein DETOXIFICATION n=1 Tax=Seminavis robusta TaxID=568900 RepID=A0A9N8HX87_9STRA|nr:Protein DETOXIFICATION [Seminavis robusta]|eukprot:Sro1767_g296280.1 Protein DETOXIFICATION (592) ;mRNA; r:6444-8219